MGCSFFLVTQKFHLQYLFNITFLGDYTYFNFS